MFGIERRPGLEEATWWNGGSAAQVRFPGHGAATAAVVSQHIAEQPGAQRGQRIGDRAQQPAEHDMGLPIEIVAAVHGIVDLVADRCGIAAFGGDGARSSGSA